MGNREFRRLASRMRRGGSCRPIGLLCAAFGLGVILATICFTQNLVVMLAAALIVLGIILFII